MRPILSICALPPVSRRGLFLAAGAALVHAVLPFCFEKTASGMINAMHHRMHNRNG